MRSVTRIWFECKVRYTKTMEDGNQKKIAENYVVDALSFGEAEKRIYEKMMKFTDGDLEIANIKIAQYKEVFFADNDLADKWYKAKIAFITFDARTNKEKKHSVYALVNSDNISKAIKNIAEIMKRTMSDYVTCNLNETQIIDVFE